MKDKMKYLIVCLVTAALFLSGCDLDVSNPNSPTSEDLKSYDGVKLLAIGMQSRLSQGVGELVCESGLVAGELNPIIGYLDYMPLRRFPDAAKRVALDATDSYVRTIWTDQYKIIKTANDILNNVNNVGMGDDTRRGIVALAEIGKVITFYNLITHWEKIPINTNVSSPEFVDRTAVIKECLSLLDDADVKIAAGAFSSEFTGNILGTGLDLANISKAFRAKFFLMKGDYANAALAALAVTAESQYVYAETNGYNPLYETFTLMQFCEGLGTWLKTAETGDTRVAAAVDISTLGTKDKSGKDIVGKDTIVYVTKFSKPTTVFKLYTLNEMTLIKAEAYARSGGDALTEVNKVRNAAGLGNYTGTNVLKEIFWQRYYELYLSGQHWEDLRRFKNDNIDIVNYQRNTQLCHEWYTYPDYEKDKNPNTPVQPTNINYGM